MPEFGHFSTIEYTRQGRVAFPTPVKDYEVFALLRVNRPRTLPVVLSRAEVRRLLGAVEHPVRRMALTTIYGLGLRLGEGLHLQSSHIDSGRQMVSLSALCRDSRWLGGSIGALAVLHTWTRTIEWHPHVHLLVPGGALAPDGRTWVRPPVYRKLYLVPERALAKCFRGRFLALARRALPQGTLPEIPSGKRWVVYAKPVVQHPEKVLEYLGRYVHRTALGDKAIVACTDQHVSFDYRDNRDHTRKTMKLPAHEFLRRFLQHVAPKGMHQVRAYGLLHSSQRHTLHRLQLLLGTRQTLAKEPRRRKAKPCCPHCRSETLQLLRRLSPEQCLALQWRCNGMPNHSARAPPVIGVSP